MPLATATVLILHADPEVAHSLVAVVERANGDVVVCEFSAEALARLRQYRFTAAVIDATLDTEAVEIDLQKRDIPYCKCPGDASTVVATLTEMLTSD